MQCFAWRSKMEVRTGSVDDSFSKRGRLVWEKWVYALSKVGLHLWVKLSSFWIRCGCPLLSHANLLLWGACAISWCLMPLLVYTWWKAWRIFCIARSYAWGRARPSSQSAGWYCLFEDDSSLAYEFHSKPTPVTAYEHLLILGIFVRNRKDHLLQQFSYRIE